MQSLSNTRRARHARKKQEERIMRSSRRNESWTQFSVFFLYISAIAIYLSHAFEQQDVFVSVLLAILSVFCIAFVSRGNVVLERFPLIIMIVVAICNEATFVIANYGNLDPYLMLIRFFIPISFFYRFMTINMIRERSAD